MYGCASYILPKFSQPVDLVNDCQETLELLLPGSKEAFFLISTKAFCVLRMLVNISETQFLHLKHVHNTIYLVGLL